jgi:hypothetical protein
MKDAFQTGLKLLTKYDDCKRSLCVARSLGKIQIGIRNVAWSGVVPEERFSTDRSVGRCTQYPALYRITTKYYFIFYEICSVRALRQRI